MSAPIAHIFMALQMLAGPWGQLFDHKKFIIGTSFPDIRYLKCVERASTHVAHITLHEIAQEPDSFRAGLLFHSWVDLHREAYYQQQGLYARFAPGRFTVHAIKFGEDEILRPLCDLQEVIPYFDDILPEERAYGIPEGTLRAWHTFLQKYCAGGWSAGDILMNYFDLNAPHAWFFQRWYFWWAYARPAQKVIAQCQQDREFQQAVLAIYTMPAVHF